MRSLRPLGIAVLLATGCGSSDREKAAKIVADTSIPTSDALVGAAEMLWRDTDGARHTISAEERAGAWRVIVIIDRKAKPHIAVNDREVTIEFYEALDGTDISRAASTLGLGAPRKLTEVLVADRYVVDVLGRSMTICAPWRAVSVSDTAVQSFDAWKAADLEKLQPYDLLMHEKGRVAFPHPTER